MNTYELSRKLSAFIKAEIFINLFNTEGCYLIPTIVINKCNRYIGIEFAFLLFSLYLSFCKGDEE